MTDAMEGYLLCLFILQGLKAIQEVLCDLCLDS